MAKSFARIHRANLINFGIIPLVLADPDDYQWLQAGQEMQLKRILNAILNGKSNILAKVKDRDLPLVLDVSSRDREILCAGGRLNHIKRKV